MLPILADAFTPSGTYALWPPVRRYFGSGPRVHRRPPSSRSCSIPLHSPSPGGSPEIRTTVVISLTRRLINVPPGRACSRVRRVGSMSEGARSSEWAYVHGKTSTRLAARGYDLAVARMSLEITLGPRHTLNLSWTSPRRRPAVGVWSSSSCSSSRRSLPSQWSCSEQDQGRGQIGTTFDPRRYVPVYLCRVKCRDYR